MIISKPVFWIRHEVIITEGQELDHAALPLYFATRPIQSKHLPLINTITCVFSIQSPVQTYIGEPNHSSSLGLKFSQPSPQTHSFSSILSHRITRQLSVWHHRLHPLTLIPFPSSTTLPSSTILDPLFLHPSTSTSFPHPHIRSPFPPSSALKPLSSIHWP